MIDRMCVCLITLLFFSTAMFAGSVRVEAFRGDEIALYAQDVIGLCNMIYRQDPYLYDGNDDEYTGYLESLSQLDGAIICLAIDGEKAVGLAVGVPMTDTRDFYKQTLLANGYELNDLFYVGEFGLSPEYRGQGIEEMLYETVEDFAMNSGTFNALCVWEIENQSQLFRENIWEKFGFVRYPELNFEISWKNIGDDFESPHLAVYSIKQLL